MKLLKKDFRSKETKRTNAPNIKRQGQKMTLIEQQVRLRFKDPNS